ncbi:GATA transcription factor 8-like [Macadamia integrifolia]|uniref:GATA transcription factor 8-like n=1 Tax=Macadamia integrifolia TaxID=60698 RepID=UPI001C52CA56|nr:GATA transcription factor 8-like [Macadamia integrifolia]XP_042476373.1 GATA transcription factor 8-like [Macadamia integrifolia]XP_042476374.1 GATA transcription factor 8-like [Macadamia integrifolia]
MIGTGFIDDLDIDLCGGFFDQIDDLLDFPIEDVECGGGGGGGGGGGECDGFEGAWLPPPPTDGLAGSITTGFPGKNDDNTTGFPGKTGDNTTVELPTELSVPHEDIAQLEWLSNFVEDSFSAGSITMENESCGNININNNNSSNIKKEVELDNKESHHRFQTSSPISVLESSSSCSGASGSSSSGYRTMPLSPETFVPGRARSKRPRPAIFNPRSLISLVSPTSSITDANPFSSSESASELDNYYGDSHHVKKIHFKSLGVTDAQQQQKKKKKKKKLPPQPFPASSDQHYPQPAAGVRKCLHCEITKTPQWRAGPLGPKTLCNACGVRYKSGRLFPEYRPAASPTFVAAIHSNSHKKVVEMRSKAVQDSPLITTPELVPNDNSLFHYI